MPKRWILVLFLHAVIPISSILARLDFFISKEEMKRLLGIEGELWYAEDGIVNRAAAEYEIEILSSIEEMYFSWRNRGEQKIRYFIDVEIEPNLFEPSSRADSLLSIPTKGHIISEIDSFYVRLPRCDLPSLRSADFRIRIRFEFDDVDSPATEFDSANATTMMSLELHRRKRCPVKLPSAVSVRDYNNDDNEGGFEDEEELLMASSSKEKYERRNKQSDVFPASSFLGSSTNAFYVSMGCLFGFVLIFSSMVVLYFTKVTTAEEASCNRADGGKEKNHRWRVGDRREHDIITSAALLSTPTKSNFPPISSSTPLEMKSTAAVIVRRNNAAPSGVVAGDNSLSSFSSSSSSTCAEKRGTTIGHSTSPSSCTTSAAAGATVSFRNLEGGGSIHQQPAALPHDTSISTTDSCIKEPQQQQEVERIIKELAVEKSDIILAEGPVLLEGTFGAVTFGRLKTRKSSARKETGQKDDDLDEECFVNVVVKTVKDKSSRQQVDLFLLESLRFVNLPAHPSVCCPTAVAVWWNHENEREDKREDLDSTNVPSPANPRYTTLCYAHDGFGNLKKFLLRCRGADPSSFSSSGGGGAGSPPMLLSTQDLVCAALQIIRGLLHLHKFRILHRDVATRNCFVGRNFTIQISDTGLSRDLFSSDYHCLGDNENRPIKWLAYESLERSEFSTASDVWSFGVALWELTTLAQQPYHDVDPFEMQAHLSADQRLSQPYNCPDELYLLMYCCWNLHPKARPTFGQLLSAMEHFYAQLTQYI